MDSAEYKYRNWTLTWSENENGLPEEESLRTFLEKNTELFVFQLERGEVSGKLHYQGCFRTKIRQRQRTLLEKFEVEFLDFDISMITINRMCGSWEENYAYCTKEDTRVGSSFVVCDALITYEGMDIKFLEKEDTRFPWQEKLINELFDSGTFRVKTPDSRKIYWIANQQGNCGKSKLAKYLCFNSNTCIKVPFGTASQIRSAVISAGPRKIYLLDIPKTLGDDDSLASIISSIEHVKDGHVCSAFYGKYTSMMFAPPHVVIFSNMRCPRKLMSADRWAEYVIDPTDKDWIPGEYLDFHWED